MKTLKVSILGGSGYTGLELLRILASHPEAEVLDVTSRRYSGKKVSEVFPGLMGFYDNLTFRDPSGFMETEAGIVFSALPHGASMEVVPELVRKGRRVIDLSADFRLRDPAVYEAWYESHGAKDLLNDAVYGLPELYRKAIKGAGLVANPGCYPTGAILALAPLLKKGLIDTDSIVIDSKSGVSGAGRKAAIETSFVEVSEGFKAYRVGCHRHTPEIEQELSALAGAPVSISFTPHLLPLSRGILSTVYARPKRGMPVEEVIELYKAFYRNERFVRVMDRGAYPNLNQVRGSNYCDIGLFSDEKKGLIIVISAIDNLVKGASGQAVQNMNIMAGIAEDRGLDSAPLEV